VTASTTDLAPELAWSACPAAERAGAAVLGLVVIVAAAGAIAVAGGHVAWGVLSAVVLLGALQRFYFRSVYSIDADGLRASYLLGGRRVRWAEVRRVVTDEHGVYLSTRARRSWLDGFRGVTVLFGGDRDGVLRSIRAHVGATRGMVA